MLSHPRRSFCLATAACLSLAVLTGTESANAARPNTPTPHKGGAQSQDHQIVGELHSTKQLLEKADHDYKGHRARVVHEISLAIHSLTHHHHPAGKAAEPKPAATSKTGDKGMKEPQEVSDAQLKQAVQQLETVKGQLKSGHEHHAKALFAVSKAIEELHTALKIK